MKMVNMKEPGLKKEGKSGGSFPKSHDVADVMDPPTIHLSHEHIKKLGLHKNLPRVGDKIPMEGHAHVASVSSHTDGDGKPRMSMTLELHKMGMEHNKPKISQPDQEAETAKGAKAEMDKALLKGQGSMSKDDAEND